MEQCKQLLAEKEYEAALHCFLEKFKEEKDPGFEYYEGIADCYWQLQRYDEALGIVNKTISRFGHKYPIAFFKKGSTLLVLGRHGEAIEAFNEMIRTPGNEKFPEAHLNKAKGLYLLGRIPEALDSYQKAIDDSPGRKYPEASFEMGNHLGHLKRYEEALFYYNEAIDSSGDIATGEMFFNKGKILCYLERFTEAIPCFDTALQHSPEKKYPRASFLKGFCLSSLGSYPEAIDSYDQTIADSPDNKFPNASYDRGNCLISLKKYRAALDSHDKAIRDSVDQKFLKAYNGRGIALNGLELYEQALAAFDRAIEDSPDGKNPAVFTNKGYTLMQMGKYEEALDVLNKAIADSPDGKPLESFTNKGSCLTKLERYEDAIECYKILLQNTPDGKDPVSWLNIGANLTHLERLPEAIDAFEKAIEQSEEGYLPIAWLVKAHNLFKLSNITQSRNAAYVSILQFNQLRPTVDFIFEHFNKHPAYEKRVLFLDLLVAQKNAGNIQQWTDAKGILQTFSHSEDTELYGNLLLFKEDVLNSGKSYTDRLREAYLVFASAGRYEWVYYIIDYLLDDGNYQLDELDQFFYLTAASRIAASKDELDTIIENSGFKNVLMKQVDDYLFQVEKIVDCPDLPSLARNESEQELLTNHFLKNQPYRPLLSNNELLSLHLTLHFPLGAVTETSPSSTRPSYLNFVDSLNKEVINPEQVAQNINDFIDGRSAEDLAAVLYRLYGKEQQGPSSSLSTVDEIILLKSFAILKFELRKRKNENKEIVLSSIIRGVLSTVIGDMVSGVVSLSFLASLGFSYALDFCLKKMDEKILISPDIDWEEFIRVLKMPSGKGVLFSVIS